MPTKQRVMGSSPLARPAYIQRLADREFQGETLVKGLALREALVRCIERIIAEANDSNITLPKSVIYFVTLDFEFTLKSSRCIT